MSTQSGALGLAILDYAHAAEHRHLELRVDRQQGGRLGQRPAFSTGPTTRDTDVILLYLESFGNPRKFSRDRAPGRPDASRSSRSRPDARTPGSRAASSHTGALRVAATPWSTRCFRQAGVIRTRTLEELFDVAALLAHQPVPRRTRASPSSPTPAGPAILAADACEANGLELPALSERPAQQLRAFLPAAASVGNPVDMLASAPPEHYRRALEIILCGRAGRQRHRDLHSAAGDRPADVAAAIAGRCPHRSRTSRCLASFMRAEGAPEALAPIPGVCVPGVGGARPGASDGVRPVAREPSRPRPSWTTSTRPVSGRSSTRCWRAAEAGLTAEEASRAARCRRHRGAASTVAATSDEAVLRGSAIGYPVALRRSGRRCSTRPNAPPSRSNLVDEAARACRVCRLRVTGSAPT